jgi:hypothetical protein
MNCSILLQHLLVLAVSLAVYAKPRCSAFIASLSVVAWESIAQRDKADLAVIRRE